MPTGFKTSIGFLKRKLIHKVQEKQDLICSPSKADLKEVIESKQISVKKENLKLYKRNFAARLNAVTHKPLEIYIEMTNCCNVRCVMCPNTIFYSGERREISRFLLDKVSEAFEHAIEVLPFGLGEPMMHEGFMWTVEKAKLSRAYVNFFTNGTLLTMEKAQRMVELSVDRITFSIDGASRETFERIREGTSFDVVVRNIRGLNEIRRRRGGEDDSKPELQMNFVAMNENFSELPDLVCLAKELGITHIDAKPLETHNDPKLEKMRKVTFSKKDQGIILNAKELARKLKITLNLSALEASLDRRGAAGVMEADRGLKSTGPICFMPWKTIYVKWDGKILPCCFGTDELILGDLNEESLEDIWNGSRSRRLREMWSRGKIPDRCSYCTNFPMRPMSDDIDEYFHKICADSPNLRSPIVSRFRDGLNSFLGSVLKYL